MNRRSFLRILPVIPIALTAVPERITFDTFHGKPLITWDIIDTFPTPGLTPVEYAVEFDAVQVLK